MATQPPTSASEDSSGRAGRKPAPAPKPRRKLAAATAQAWLAWTIRNAGLTQADAAALIAQETGRPCSVRAVRSWLAAPERTSASPCPQWAVEALQRRLVALASVSG